MRLLSLCVVAGLVMLAAASAHAGWRTDLSLKEQPNHVLEVWGPERFSVGHGQGAYLFVDGGVARTIVGTSPGTGSAVTYYQLPEDCFVSVSQEPGGQRTASGVDGAECGPHGESLLEGSVMRLKHARDGGAVAVVTLESEKVVYESNGSVYDSAAFTRTLLPSDVVRYLTGVLGVVRAGSDVYALFGTMQNDSSVHWYKLGALNRMMETRAQPGLQPAVVQAIELFSAGDPAAPLPYAVVGTQHALLQGSTLASPEPLKPVHLFEDDAGVLGISMNVGAGGDAGRGFGMAIVGLPDGGRQVVSPVPMLSDTKAGTVWRERSIPGRMAKAPLIQVACAEASYCVFSAEQADGGDNLFIYTNDAGPRLSVTVSDGGVVDPGPVTSLTLEEDGHYQLTFAAKDPDGDPVLVTAFPPESPRGWSWVPDAGYDAGDPVVWDVTTSTTCESGSGGRFKVSASDGLARHEAYETVEVYVKHTRVPELPPVVFADGGIVPSSGPVSELSPEGSSLTLRMTGDGTTAAGCKVHPEWRPLFPGTVGPSLVQDGGTAEIMPFCSRDGGSFDFRLSLTDDAGLSNSRDFNVRVAPMMPVDVGALWLDGGTSPSGELQVDVGSDLNCIEYRELRADLWLERLDGGALMEPETVVIPGTWRASLEKECGRPLLLKGVMEDNTGQRSTVRAREIATPRVDAGLEPLSEVPALVARCGEQARITLTQTFPPGACQTPDVTWVQDPDGGLPLEQDVLSGPTVSLVTRDTGLDALVGKSLVMWVTASAGPGNTASQRVTVPITVEPFVRVRRRTELPAVSETGLVGVSVDLHNTTACEVTGVSYVERLEGLTYVEGSAKFDGQPVEASWASRALTVTGLTLPAEGTGRLTYVARPHLVGERRMEGDALLGTEIISLRNDPGPQVPDSGCGCSGSGPGPVLFALGALVAAVRRRRRG
jgi:MYXO-CTERM domain-containing protein